MILLKISIWLKRWNTWLPGSKVRMITQSVFVDPSVQLSTFPWSRGSSTSWGCGVRCLVMQGGQGDVKHWAFNDPPRRTAEFIDAPPSPAQFRQLGARV